MPTEPPGQVPTAPQPQPINIEKRVEAMESQFTKVISDSKQLEERLKVLEKSHRQLPFSFMVLPLLLMVGIWLVELIHRGTQIWPQLIATIGVLSVVIVFAVAKVRMSNEE